MATDLGSSIRISKEGRRAAELAFQSSPSIDQVLTAVPSPSQIPIEANQTMAQYRMGSVKKGEGCCLIQIANRGNF